MRLSKTITYYYPDGENPSAVKVFQDRSSQVKGFKFKKEYLSSVQKEEHSDNYGIYFLLGENHGVREKREVYVGQSKSGIQRIFSHNRNEDFWVDCIMFVSDNNIFDTNTIDYMEYYFINLIKKSPQYVLNNVEQRNKEPNLNHFDKVLYETYLNQIEFLLKAEGIYLDSKQDEDALQNTSNISQNKSETTSNEYKENYDSSKLYFVKDKRYNASVRYENGLFILTKGSIIHKPRKRMLNWQDGGKLYRRIVKEQSEYEENGLLEDMGDKYKVLSEIPFKSPTAAGQIVIGSRVYGGWKLFENIEELRDEYALQNTSNISQSKPETTSNEYKENYDSSKLYFPINDKYNASVRYENGLFILTEGSIINKPRKEMLNWYDGGRLYRRLIKEQSEYEKNGLIEDMGDKYKVLSEIPFESPSGASIIVSASSRNGWEFFKNIKELK